MAPAHDMLDEVSRGLVNLPNDESPGARDAAQLTAWRSAQNYALKPVTEALGTLRRLEKWDGEFLVADTINFNLRTAPLRQYASFEQFYRDELEETWSAWEAIHAEARRLVAGGENTRMSAIDLPAKPAPEANDVFERGLGDLPVNIPPGAREVALLTAWCAAQRYAMEPVMRALAGLRVHKEWPSHFLVADTSKVDWRTAPFRKYASFEQFCSTELDATWAAWDAVYAREARQLGGIAA